MMAINSYLMQHVRRSFKVRVITIILLSTLIPLFIIGIISYYSIISMLNNKIEGSIKSNLQQTKTSLENIVNSLNYVSQQLAFDQRIYSDLEKLSSATSLFEKSQYEKAIMSTQNFVSFTNPNVGFTFYFYENSNQPIFQDTSLMRKFEPQKLPIMMKLHNTIYYGPHRSVNRYNENEVFSVTRRLEAPGYEGLNVYIESSSQQLFPEQPGFNVKYLIVDQHDRVAYSEYEQQYPVGLELKANELIDDLNVDNDRFLFVGKSSQGWRMVSVIPKESYYKERDTWLMQYVLIAIGSIGLALLLSLFVWKTVITPLSQLRREILNLENSNFHSPAVNTRFNEFDRLLTHFQRMKEQVLGLIVEIEVNEKQKAELEIEKLLHQINPHFIHNTLDTVRWVARTKGDREIDHLVSTLNKLLYYNMGKRRHSTIREEIEAIGDYILLQRMRYDFEFALEIQADESIMDMEIPRFILQPLVENCLYHGLKDDGVIQVGIREENKQFIVISVSDNGAGMDNEKVQALFDPKAASKRSSGFGIGLSYVQRMLKSQFGSNASFIIESTPGEGTKMSISIPFVEGNSDV
ncbi:sensor histidine kinase [Cohnella abietis]|uniref:histidine kinase n=1 Tax=Cohnella abietis TaxID=2507935 RepID=A0A3T1D3V4_9BACL|nr:histidine kinase [Cohnella abietis]BBI32731.1 histidine kinase [Cohnella abietis]